MPPPLHYARPQSPAPTIKNVMPPPLHQGRPQSPAPTVKKEVTVRLRLLLAMKYTH